MASASGPDGGREETRPPGPSSRAKTRSNRAKSLSSDLTFDEQVEIIGQINRVVARNKIQITDKTFTFSARKRGGLIPLLINLGALVLTMSAGAVLIRHFDRQEATLVAEATRVLTAEAKLIEAFKEETEARLGEKDREIAAIRQRLAGLDEERRRLQMESEARVQERETELQAELDRQLDLERRKLREEGATDAAIRRQLSDLETRLGEENRARLAALRQQSERDLAARDAELAGLQEELRQREGELEARFRSETERLAAERAEADAQLSRLRENRQQEDLVLDQLLERYARVEGELAAGRHEAALRELDGLENFLAAPAVAALPAVRQRLPLDRFTVASLRSLIASRLSTSAAEEAAGAAEELLAEIAALTAAAERAEGAGNKSEALGLYGRALAVIPELEAGHAALLAPAAEAAAAAERQLAAARAEVQRLNRELRNARTAEEARRALSERLAALRRSYGEVSRRSAAERLTPEQVLALVETKLRVREAMTSEPMKSRYPDLYAALEEYLDAFAAEQQARAQDAALGDVRAVLETLAQRRESMPPLQGHYSTPRGDLFAELLKDLAGLLD